MSCNASPTALSSISVRLAIARQAAISNSSDSFSTTVSASCERLACVVVPRSDWIAVNASATIVSAITAVSTAAGRTPPRCWSSGW